MDKYYSPSDLFDDYDSSVLANDYFEKQPVPARLQEYDTNDLTNPDIALGLVRILRDELDTAGKRNFTLAKEAKEGLEYIYDLFPEYQHIKVEPIKDIEDVTNLDASFEGDTESERVEWLKSLYADWSAKKKRNDSKVQIVKNPMGDGFALEYINSELGYVKDLTSLDNGQAGIETFEDIHGAVDRIDVSGLIDLTLSEDDILNEAILAERAQLIEDLSGFAGIDFIDSPPDVLAASEEDPLRKNFTEKALDILDTAKRWPKLADNEITGWQAMEIAKDKGYKASIKKDKDNPTEYWLDHKDEKVRSIRIKKAEFEYYHLIGAEILSPEENTLTEDRRREQKQPIISGEERHVLDKEGEEFSDDKRQLHEKIGNALFPGMNLNPKDAHDAGVTYDLFDKGVLNRRDWQYFKDRLADQYLREQAASENDPQREGFTQKALEILDSAKRWPKLADNEITGWQAMEIAKNKGYNAIIKQSKSNPAEYWLDHEGDNVRPIRIKKAEYEYYHRLDNKSRAGEGTELPETMQENRVQKLLSTPWPSAESLLLEYEILSNNTTFEPHRVALQASVEKVKAHMDQAKSQMKQQGYVSDNLADIFKLLPSKHTFEQDLLSNRVAKSPDGSVLQISKDDAQKFVILAHQKSGEILEINPGENESPWTLHEAVQAALETTPYRTKQSAVLEKKEIYKLSFKKFLSEVHGIDPEKLVNSNRKAHTRHIHELLQDWGRHIVEAAEKGHDVPQENIRAFKSAVENALLNVNPTMLPDMLRNEAKKAEWHHYGVLHPRGVGLGASPAGHVAYKDDRTTFLGGVVTYDHELSERDVEHYSYTYLGKTDPGQEIVLPAKKKLVFPEVKPKEAKGKGPVSKEVRDVYPFEMTLREFSRQYGELTGDLPSKIKAHVTEYYSDPQDVQTVNKLVADGQYESPAAYIHARSVKGAVERRISVAENVLADYPRVKPPLPEIWEITKDEFLKKAACYKKISSCDDAEFLQRVISGEFHRSEVARAIEEGFEVPDKVLAEYPDLDNQTPRIAM